MLMGVNSHEVRSATATSAYETIFGVHYHEKLKCHIGEMKPCKTLTERLRPNPDPRLEATLKEIFLLDDDEAADEDNDGKETEPTELYYGYALDGEDKNFLSSSR
ncbi:hypothetical protein IV203_028886 [Nitzschia inconspicua]|uniref:Uncharacterized protein n=1 Tax=Nitzschia inconspicua TaxID=303405 RepID=A0A9K3LSJ1_9STRA|nr:hypothetical protein IV203_028886 [Nitzschia inconspicua]